MFMVFCINAIVSDHFKMLVRDMYDQVFDKEGSGKDGGRIVASGIPTEVAANP